MIVFVALIKALLLHKTDANLVAQVTDPERIKLLTKLASNQEYQEWLADRFFIFYLNRVQP
jgi:hypothetical protein